MWLLRQLVQLNSVTPDRVVKKYRSMYVLVMEGNPKGRIDPKPGQFKSSSAGTGQLESLSAGTGFEASGQ